MLMRIPGYGSVICETRRTTKKGCPVSPAALFRKGKKDEKINLGNLLIQVTCQSTQANLKNKGTI